MNDQLNPLNPIENSWLNWNWIKLEKLISWISLNSVKTCKWEKSSNSSFLSDCLSLAWQHCTERSHYQSLSIVFNRLVGQSRWSAGYKVGPTGAEQLLKKIWIIYFKARSHETILLTVTAYSYWNAFKYSICIRKQSYYVIISYISSHIIYHTISYHCNWTLWKSDKLKYLSVSTPVFPYDRLILIRPWLLHKYTLSL